MPMLTDAATIALLIKALGYGVPAAFLVLSLLVVMILTKYQQTKSDKDRKEHMSKWNSMIELQDKSITSQEKVTLLLVENHKLEINRMFQSIERQAQTLESIGHNLSVVTRKLEEHTICPKDINAKEPK